MSTHTAMATWPAVSSPQDLAVPVLMPSWPPAHSSSAGPSPPHPSLPPPSHPQLPAWVHPGRCEATPCTPTPPHPCPLLSSRPGCRPQPSARASGGSRPSGRTTRSLVGGACRTSMPSRVSCGGVGVGVGGWVGGGWGWRRWRWWRGGWAVSYLHPIEGELCGCWWGWGGVGGPGLPPSRPSRVVQPDLPPWLLSPPHHQHQQQQRRRCCCRCPPPQPPHPTSTPTPTTPTPTPTLYRCSRRGRLRRAACRAAVDGGGCHGGAFPPEEGAGGGAHPPIPCRGALNPKPVAPTHLQRPFHFEMERGGVRTHHHPLGAPTPTLHLGTHPRVPSPPPPAHLHTP